MERTWYIIVDMDGYEIHTADEQEAKKAFRYGGIVTIVQESVIYHEDITVSTRIISDMKKIQPKD